MIRRARAADQSAVEPVSKQAARRGAQDGGRRIRLNLDKRPIARTWILLGTLPFLFYGLHHLERRIEGAPAPALHVAGPMGLSIPGSAAAAERNAVRGTGLVRESRREYRTEGLRPGGTLNDALERLGLSAAGRQRAITELGRHLDLRRLPSSTGLSTTRDGTGRLLSIAVRTEADRFLRLTEKPDAEPVVEIVNLPRVTRIESAGGRVDTSVHQALSDSPLAHELTLAFADIVQWDIDLLVEPRSGDRVGLVYEVYLLGQVPDDLPPFGDAARRAGELLGLGHVLAASYEGRIARSIGYRVEGPDGFGDYYDEAGRPLRKTFLKSPLNYRRISSRFSRARRHPVTRRVVPHHGVDFAAAPGTPVVASADGRVVSAGWEGALGRAVRIRHGEEFVTVYGHLRGVARGVGRGVEVKQNQVIGYVGSSGRATGPHLHYSLIQYGKPIDPMSLRNMPVEPLAPVLRPRLEQAKLALAPLLGAISPSVADAGGSVGGLRRGA